MIRWHWPPAGPAPDNALQINPRCLPHLCGPNGWATVTAQLMQRAKQGMSLSRQTLIGASPILNLILPTFLHFGTQSHRHFVTTFSCSVINLRGVPYASAKSNCSAPPNMLSFPCLCSSFFFCLQFPISELCPCKSVLKQSSRISSSTSLPEKISRVSVNTPKKAGGAHSEHSWHLSWEDSAFCEW